MERFITGLKTGLVSVIMWTATIALILWLSGCMAIETSKVCQSIPEGQVSAICTLAEKMNTTPEAIVKVVQFDVMFGLEKGSFEAKQASDYIADIRKKVTEYQDRTDITLEDVLNYANDKYKLLSPKAQAAMVIINPTDLSSYGIELPMIPRDFQLLLIGLDEEQKIIDIYL